MDIKEIKENSIIVELVLNRLESLGISLYTVGIFFNISDIPSLQKRLLDSGQCDYKFGMFFLSGEISLQKNPYGFRLVKLTSNIFKKVLKYHSIGGYNISDYTIYIINEEAAYREVFKKIDIRKSTELIIDEDIMQFINTVIKDGDIEIY